MPRKSLASRPARPSPLQNRVDVYGELVRTDARGKVMGNRGILHDEAYNIVRPWKLKMWISCVLNTNRTREVQLDDNRAFNGRKRELMSLWHYTELFYLDEVTALATGARPCGCCRRTDYDAFKDAWRRSRGLGSRPLNSAMMDDELHVSRLPSAGRAALVKIDWASSEPSLPNGVMVDFPEEGSGSGSFCGAYLVWDGYLRKWSWEGYGPPLQSPTIGISFILTPACIVDCLRGGYRPVHCPFVAGIDEAVRPWQDPPNGRADAPPSHLRLTEWKKCIEVPNEKGLSRGYGKGYAGGRKLLDADADDGRGQEAKMIKKQLEAKRQFADNAHPKKQNVGQLPFSQRFRSPNWDNAHAPEEGLVETTDMAVPVVRRWRKRRTLNDADIM